MLISKNKFTSVNKMTFKIFALVPVAIFLLVAIVSGQEREEVSQVCLGCICEAVSGCNTTQGCSGDICGPFHITWGYWSDGGKPTLNGEPVDDKSYASCTNDAFCAARAIQGYMEKYAQDCNGDGKIDCDDYVRIHYLGGYGCSGSLQPKYENAYNNCKASFG